MIVILLLVAGAHAADLALTLGDGLLAAGHPHEAVTEYKRYLCFNPTGAQAGDAWFGLGVALQALGDDAAAEKVYTRALDAAPDEAARDARRVAISVQQLAAGHTDAAERALTQVLATPGDPAQRRRARLLLGLCALYGYRWAEASASLRAYFPAPPSPAQAAVLARLAHPPRHVSPVRARLLSTLLPGAGQLYAGAPGAAANALGLNLLTGSLVVGPLLAGDAATAVVNYLGFFSRYYEGNRFHARRLAVARNDLADRRFLAEVLAALPAAVEGGER
jgi:tetratricopeptide (TPR) repeat protein